MPQTFLYATRGLLHKKQKNPNKTKTKKYSHTVIDTCWTSFYALHTLNC